MPDIECTPRHPAEGPILKKRVLVMDFFVPDELSGDGRDGKNNYEQKIKMTVLGFPWTCFALARRKTIPQKRRSSPRLSKRPEQAQRSCVRGRESEGRPVAVRAHPNEIVFRDTLPIFSSFDLIGI